MRFIWKGDEVFAKHVQYPGTKAYRMVAITREDVVNRLENLERELAKQLVNKSGQGAE